MIERVYLKESLSFKEVELNLSNGLMIFTGPSGAGKSVLMQSVLAIFGMYDAKASISEATLSGFDLDLDEYGLEFDDEIIFREVKKDKVRYFINSQAISKKNIKNIATNFIDYLSLKNVEEFSNEALLEVVDLMVDNEEFNQLKSSFKIGFKEYKNYKKELAILEEKEKKSNELKEFLRFEIQKIDEIGAKEGEFEELMKIKKELSKIDKIKELSSRVTTIFNYENDVSELLSILEIDSGFFDDTMNELKSAIDDIESRSEFLENIDVEEVLDRLEKIQGLIKRFGSVAEAMEYKKEKQEELKELENLSFSKKELQDKISILDKELNQKAKEMRSFRENGIKGFEKRLNHFLGKVYMPNAKLSLGLVELNQFGIDEVNLEIEKTDINSLSTGEFNRLRLALLASKLEFVNQPKSLFLDEIDANLSGEESMSVALVLKYLSEKYQIFAISHQPQLTSQADKHFLVLKEQGISKVKELSKEERVNEIARIISGKELKKEAVEYAKELLKEV